MVYVTIKTCLDTHLDFNYGHRYFEDKPNYLLKQSAK